MKDKVLQLRGMLSQTISVVIPVFNGAEFLSAAIDSVLHQTIQPTEIVVVDDGSTDRTVDICKKYGSRVSYFYQEHRGEFAARNMGLRQSRSEFIAFLDADDVWLPHALSALIQPFLQNKDLMLSVGQSQMIIREGRGWRNDQKPYIGVHLSATMISRKVFELVGLFNENFRSAGDTDFIFRVRENQLLIQYVNQTVVYYRRHENNVTLCEATSREGLLLACRFSIERRRAQGPDIFLQPYGCRRSIL